MCSLTVTVFLARKNKLEFCQELNDDTSKRLKRVLFNNLCFIFHNSSFHNSSSQFEIFTALFKQKIKDFTNYSQTQDYGL